MGEYERSIPETTISEEQANIIEEFSFFEDWMDRYQYLIDIGLWHHWSTTDQR